MNVLLTYVKALLKEEIKGKSSYSKFMDLIKPIDQYITQNMKKMFHNSKVSLSMDDVSFILLKNRVDDIKFDLRSLKKEVAYNNGIIDFSNIDTYDDYAIEDIFKNTHILVDNLQALNK